MREVIHYAGFIKAEWCTHHNLLLRHPQEVAQSFWLSIS